MSLPGRPKGDCRSAQHEGTPVSRVVRPVRRLAGLAWALAMIALTILLTIAPTIAAAEANDISPAERAIFMDNQLANIKPPTTLNYGFRKSGSLEEAFEDQVHVKLAAQPDGSCCAAKVQFFTGPRQVSQPEVPGAQGNPAILYFLERDIREMERLTKGKANYFRKRIRMAVFNGATIREISLPYRGKSVAVREISIAPYADDPNRARFDTLANKRYVFLLASAVPGGLYGIRSRIDAAGAAAPPLIAEEMMLDGAQPAPPNR
jgi:hypothetical protein